MTGIEIAVGYVFAWAVRKARRVGGRADGEVDLVLDTGMDRVHELIAGKLGDHSALQRVEAEAEVGQSEPSLLTRRELETALRDAAEQDPGFGDALAAAVQDLQARAGGQTVLGDVRISARGNSVAAWTISGDVTVGGPTGADPQQG